MLLDSLVVGVCVGLIVFYIAVGARIVRWFEARRIARDAETMYQDQKSRGVQSIFAAHLERKRTPYDKRTAPHHPPTRNRRA